jgi:hypothetical protein
MYIFPWKFKIVNDSFEVTYLYTKIEGIITKAIDSVAWVVYSYSSFPLRSEINILNAIVNLYILCCRTPCWDVILVQL